MALWQQIIAVLSITIAIVASRTRPDYLYSASIWKTVPLLFLIQMVFYLSYSVVVYPIYLSPLRKFPRAPGASLFMGNFAQITKLPSGEPMKEWMETVPNDGIIEYRTAFNAQRVLVTNPKALAEVLQLKSYDFVKPWQLREGLGRLLGVGILLAEGDEHKRQRKNLNPAFAFRHVKDLCPVFWAKSLEMVHGMHKAITEPAAAPLAAQMGDAEKSDKKPSATNVVDVGPWASRTTLDIIGLAGMGRDFNSLADPSNHLYQTYNNIFRPSRTARILGIASLLVPTWILRNLPLKRNDDVNAASETIKSVARDLIQAKRAKLEKGGVEEAGIDIISVALQSGGFTDEDLVNQLMTFLAAGHETTASSMNWAIMQLCQNPSVQERLRHDLAGAGIRSPFSSQGADARSMTAADIEKVPYLSAVINEVLRLNPPVALTLRSAHCDTSIIGHFIPKGTTVILCPLAVNQNTALWGPDAREFKPERWLAPGQAGSGGAKSAYSFMTFLHGPRGCIGSAFARAEFAILLAAWIISFETELEDPERVIEVAGGITSRPKGGLRVKLTPVTD